MARFPPSDRPNDEANKLEISCLTSVSNQVELMAIFPVKPASVRRARLSPLGIGIAFLVSSVGRRQIIFLFTTFCLVLLLFGWTGVWLCCSRLNADGNLTSSCRHQKHNQNTIMPTCTCIPWSFHVEMLQFSL